jgi:hypothetical protein
MAQGGKPGAITIADRGWRTWTRLRLDDDGITIRNFFRAYRIGWHEVRWFEDGSVPGRRAHHWWALRIVLHDGRMITADGTSSWKTAARPETLTAIKQAAERHAVPAELTGMPPATGPGVITIADSGWWAWAWLRLDDDGITVRNFFRTYRIGWDEVHWFTDGSVPSIGGPVYFWALDIVLHDGCMITASGASSRTGDARPGTLTAIRQAAERHAVPAVFTGTPVESGAPDSPGLYPDPGPGRNPGRDRRGGRPYPDSRRRPAPAAGPKTRRGQSLCRYREHPAEGLPAAG